MPVSSTTLQTVLLKLLAKPDTDARLGGGSHYSAESLRSQFPPSEQPTSREIMSVVWSLVCQGLAYIDYSQSAPENWKLFLTDAGLAAAHDEAMNPDNSGDYLERLAAGVPEANPIFLQYAREAVVSYNSRCYLASAVMLGVASEAAFLEMARSFGNWLPKGQGQKFLEVIENPRSNYITKFVEFRKKVEPLKSNIPDELSDSMSLWLDSVLDLLRIYRNEAGHPTGKQLAREDAFINLQMFARYLQKLYALKAVFDSGQLTNSKRDSAS